nr:MAG TPA: hypothetical protein [Caudoviricetes sp.]
MIVYGNTSSYFAEKVEVVNLQVLETLKKRK